MVIQTDSGINEGENRNGDVFNERSGVKLVAVIELVRDVKAGDTARGPFREEDEEIADSYSTWGEVALHYSDLHYKIGRQRNLSGFLLDVVK